MNTVLTLGTFDLFHPGHVELLEQCARIAGPEGTVHVAVNPDWFVTEFKGRAPVQTFLERSRMIASCVFVDEVHTTPGPDCRPIIDELSPDFVVIGKDWASRDYYGQLGIDETFLAERACSVVYIERAGDFSSTDLKARVRALDPVADIRDLKAATLTQGYL